MVTDTCFTNDICETATLIPNVVTDSTVICVDGCNLMAHSESYPGSCSFNFFPTVWYKVITDESATHLNIRVTTVDFDSISIGLVLMESNCSSLTNFLCEAGVNGEVEIIDTKIKNSSTYLIAVTAVNSQGGNFQLCLNTVLYQSTCVILSDLEIKSRSFGGNLNGPFLPGETISVCMNVNSYTASGNGCQWFQGLIPVFGDNWDLSSFDEYGQPKSATINGAPIGIVGNGVYGASTWDWFTDIGFHHTNQILQVGDLDGNGTIELCHSLYEDCPDLGGVTGGCCGSCWDDPGDILPPGWFAYGINGTCPDTAHPTVDWGDGNTCEGGMGPWSFCFDLKVKSFPDCLMSDSLSDLKLGFYTTADGETGAWTGGPSVCINDKPQIRYFKSTCEEGTGLELDHGLNSREIKVYPVPAGNKVFVEWPVGVYHENQINLLDPQGKLVLKISLDTPGENRKEIDISHLNSGIYLINLISGNKNYTARLVKI